MPTVAVGIGVGVAVGCGVAVGTGVGVGAGVAVGTGVGVGVGVLGVLGLLRRRGTANPYAGSAANGVVSSVEVRQNAGEGIYTPPLGSGDGVGEARLSQEAKAELLAVLSQRRREWWLHR